ncbi:MAG: translocation/assembly module TamB domain-containing protein [Negativicutes bacterium]
MRRKAMWIALPLLAVVGLLAFWWAVQGKTLLSDVKNATAEELTRAFGTEVSVGTAELTAWNVVTLTNSKIFDRQGRELANIPEAVVEIDPIRLLWTRGVVESIARVMITRPEISLYRDKAGKWNIDELLTRDLPESRAFRGKLTLADGQVFLHDDNRVWQIAPVAGSMDFALTPSIQFRLNLRGQDQRARTFGTFTSQGYGVVTLQGQNQNLESWQGLFPGDWPLADLKGHVALIDITLKKDRDGLKFAGEIKPNGVSGRFAGIDWGQVTGLITFSEQEVQLYNVAGKIAGQDLTASGKVLRPMGAPELQIQLRAAGIELKAMDGTLPVAGRVGVEATLSGAWKALQAEGLMRLDNGEISGWTLEKFTTRFAGRRLGDDWTLRTTDGQGTLSGEPLRNLEISVFQQQGQLLLQALSAGIGSGSMAANGTLGSEALDLNVLAASLPMSLLSRVYPELQASGALDFTGRLTGAPMDVQIAGTVMAVDGKILQQPFTRATGQLALHGGTLSLAHVEVRNGQGLHEINGNVSLTGRRALDLRIKTQGARAEDLVAWLAPGEALTGNIENEVTLGGTLDAIEAEGKLTLWEGSYRGYLLSRVSGDYRRSGGILTVSELEVDSFNAKAILSGTMDQNQRLNFTVIAKEVETAYIQIKYPYPVQGKLSLKGALTGTTQQPEFTGEVMSRTLRLNGQELFDIGGEIVLHRDEVQVSAVHFLLGKGQVRANGGYREKSEEVYGGLWVENTEIAALLTILNTPLKGVSGRLEGQVALTGTTANPAIQLFGTLHAGRIKGYALDNIELDVGFRNKVFTVNNFRALQGTGFIVAKGTADLKGSLAMEIGGKDIDAGILTAWLDSRTEVQGKMNFLAQLGGTAASPKVGLSFDIHDGGVTNATFDELYGLFVLQDDIIQVNQLYITKGEHRASAYGTLPLKALNASPGQAVGNAASMDLRLRLDQANLSILPLLSPEVQWALGATTGEVSIRGTWARPVFSGRISVADGALKLKSLADPLEKLGIDIQFEDDKMNVTRVSGTMGGGSFLLQGTAALNGEQGLAAYEAKLTLDRLGIRHKYFKGPLNGNITLMQHNGSPKIAGKLVFENMTLNVPGIPDAPQSEMDVAMDLEIVVGKDVRAYSPSLYDIRLGGGLHLGGTVRDPRITGKILLARGSVDYLGARFRLSEGFIDFPQRRSMDPQVHLEAAANFSRTKVMLNIDGPASKMDLKLSSIPALSPQEIRTVLTLRPRSGETVAMGMLSSDALAREEIRALLTSGLRMQVFGQFENTVRDALGLDDFRLVSGVRTNTRGPVTFGSAVAAGTPASLQEVYNLEFSKYFGDRVEATYSIGLNRNEYQATIRYDISEKFSINLSDNERSSPRLGIEYRIRF